MNQRNEVIPHDTEDRGWWYLHGEEKERRFVELCCRKLGLNAQINPEKNTNRYAPDLLVNDVVADLKTQNTPFFSAKRYRIDPRFGVTFNRKDYERYKSHYPEIDIFFWIDWAQTESKWGSVDYFGGIFRLPFREVARLIEIPAPEHEYQHRQDPNDKNAKSSFILDIREFEPLFTVENRGT